MNRFNIFVVSTFGTLTAVFVAQKVAGQIDWDWVWVLSPLWVLAALFTADVIFDFARRATNKVMAARAAKKLTRKS